MDIVLKNCNNIENGQISIQEDNLNIKYAINGTGKSTISRAIMSYASDSINNTTTLNDLKPFKYRSVDDNNPEILGCEEISKVKIFNEKYINEYVFKPDELLQGSFDIFIQDENYIKGLEEIDALVVEIKKTFENDQDIENLTRDFDEMSNSFGRNTARGIHGSSNLAKAFKNGNKVENIPEELKDYKNYIQHGENYKWIKWQQDGKGFIDITENCPYCVSNIETKKEKIVKIGEVYDSKTIQNLNKIIEVFQSLNKYFSDSTKDIISEFIKTIDGYTDEQVEFLREVKEQIDRLNDKFKKAKNLSFESLKDVDKMIEALQNYKIDLKLYGHLNSESTEEKAKIVNTAIDGVLVKAGILQGKIAQQKRYIERLVEKNKNNINSFLKNAGYKYSVDLVENEVGKHQLKLIHDDLSNEVKNATDHLSFGEKNAFALVLFMYDALKAQPNLIILDDPISSFDKNKKYAIIDMLFRKNDSFKDKTVLLLTHDFEPIVDMIHHHRDRFKIPTAAFLENNSGELIEKLIERSDIQTFIELIHNNISEAEDNIQKLVYLRRLYEITNNKNMEYHIISSAIHKKSVPEFKSETNMRVMTTEEIENGEIEIRKHIADFDYNHIVSRINDDSVMKALYLSSSNNYEKLHMFRMIFDDKEQVIESDIINKFINEAFHLENDYIYQLNPRKYQMVPQYVINECNRLINLI